MKKILILCIVALLGACSSDSTEDVSSVTNYPTFEVIGDDTIFIMQGETYTEPGVIATEGEEEIDFTTSYSGMYRGETSLNTNVSDVYTITYSAVNRDGFTGTATRTVIVVDNGDLENSIAGLYRSTVFRNGVQGSPASNYTDMEYILIWENEDGTYEVSDALGGWYLLGRAIAGSASPGGLIVANNISANDFSFPGTQTNDYFGGESHFTSLTVDNATNSLDLTTVWVADPATTYNFNIHLEQVQF